MNWEEKYNALAELVDGYRRERDEARAEVERLRTALLEVQTSESAPAWFADGFHDGWKAGAEAMREACAARIGSDPALLMSLRSHCESALRALPIPEDK